MSVKKKTLNANDAMEKRMAIAYMDLADVFASKAKEADEGEEKKLYLDFCGKCLEKWVNSYRRQLGLVENITWLREEDRLEEERNAGDEEDS